MNTRSAQVQLHDVGEGVVVVQLDRPAKLNALSTSLEQELLDILATPSVTQSRAVVLTGHARAFSVGADTTELIEMTPSRIAHYYRGSGSLYEVVARLPQPTVAAISGHCLGGGFELALACDIRIADETARFAFPEVGLGILPSSGGISRVTRAVGPAVARSLVLLGEAITGTEAHRLGLVYDVTPAGSALDRAQSLATALARLPALAVTWAKAAIDAAADSSLATSLLVEQLAYAALNSVATQHQKEIS